MTYAGRVDLIRALAIAAKASRHRQDRDPRQHPAQADQPDALVVAVVEVFDALVHDQPYKQAWSIDEAVGEISVQRGRQFDPDVVDAFLRLDHGQLASGEQIASEVL
jgi:hypothetical protein